MANEPVRSVAEGEQKQFTNWEKWLNNHQPLILAKTRQPQQQRWVFPTISEIIDGNLGVPPIMKNTQLQPSSSCETIYNCHLWQLLVADRSLWSWLMVRPWPLIRGGVLTLWAGGAQISIWCTAIGSRFFHDKVPGRDLQKPAIIKESSGWWLVAPSQKICENQFIRKCMVKNRNCLEITNHIILIINKYIPCRWLSHPLVDH